MGARRVACAVSVIVLLLGSCSQSSLPNFVARGRALPLPDDQLTPVTEAEFEGILVGLRGRPVVVNIWASWCPPCRTEAPLLQRAADRYGDRVQFVGVDAKDDPGPAAAFLDRYKIRYPNVFDASGSDIPKAMSLRGFPTTYVFDADGKLQRTVFGGISEQSLAGALDSALAR